MDRDGKTVLPASCAFTASTMWCGLNGSPSYLADVTMRIETGFAPEITCETGHSDCYSTRITFLLCPRMAVISAACSAQSI